jgi:hypothetical protein
MLNIFVLALAATGLIFWVCVCFVVWFYWMCKRPPQE